MGDPTGPELLDALSVVVYAASRAGTSRCEDALEELEKLDPWQERLRSLLCTPEETDILRAARLYGVAARALERDATCTEGTINTPLLRQQRSERWRELMAALEGSLEPGAPVFSCSCPCCGATLEVECGDAPGTLGVCGELTKEDKTNA